MYKIFNFLLGIFSILYLSVSSRAANWQKCDLTLKILNTRDQVIQAKLVRIELKTTVECPKIGEQIVFKPKTKDWQNELPRRL
ncbi:hypothetical protein EXD98_13820 [Acinetobacter pittii]|uniref:Uncharacterized protein n=1 Tax=Acinetobacter pittii TaxID=48296 RepID=A0AAE8KF28_ACIPI|nr:hypothetical protein [Acinetobacter pittii]RZH26922.1 hypothetical protein EXD98_13820 [Acinetobacter pittii]